ncbi:hypothetical protein DFH06DRAFT_1303635 [Mycena polygramma]|nr:hypothetical protein DFH06DRAFT_1303635 [Mycena polygramma]
MPTDSDSTSPPPYCAAYIRSNPARRSNSTLTRAPSSESYIYYRVYTSDGVIPAKSMFDPTNPFVGRIPAKSVPPPHNTMSLKRCIASAEFFPDRTTDSNEPSRTLLFLNQAAQVPMEETGKVVILGAGDGPGKSPETAFALKVVDHLSTQEAANVESIDISHARVTSGYLYYQLYHPTGQDSSKLCFDPEEPSLGRLERVRIAPPICPESIKRCIAEVEASPSYANAGLYLDISSEAALDDRVRWEAIQSGTAGSVKECPMVLERQRTIVPPRPATFVARAEPRTVVPARPVFAVAPKAEPRTVVPPRPAVAVAPEAKPRTVFPPRPAVAVAGDRRGTFPRRRGMMII